jgi:L-fuculose-phosphate aldolase
MIDSTLDRIHTLVRKAVLDCLIEAELISTIPENPLALFESEAALRIKEEIVRNGRKLWERQYVDGNGGNISARLSADYILCTPTLLSKGDLCVDDLVLVDLDNQLICGRRAQTSEILLHLQLYKTVPEAMAVIHCHPPYATAHAVAGVIPQGNLVPEQEVFVGPVALTPYETPGTLVFAKTIEPVARQHNTILLSNHGVVCWADTVTHAEWYVEVIDTYCKTVMIANQLKSPLPEIPPDKILDLLAIKQHLGLPDARLPPPAPHVAASCAPKYTRRRRSNREVEDLVSSITTQIAGVVERRD